MSSLFTRTLHIDANEEVIGCKRSHGLQIRPLASVKAESKLVRMCVARKTMTPSSFTLHLYRVCDSVRLFLYS
jgi:hypothetical protein